MLPQSPFTIANYFIQKAAETGISLTPMKLIKLVYIAHGWHLGITGEALIREPIEAWKYGPVIESLYHALKQYGNSSIPPEAKFLNAGIPNDPEVKKILDKVWDSYAKYSAAELSTLTHQSDTPWRKVYEPGERYTIIPDNLIKEHYKGKIDAKRRQSAA